MRQSSKQQWPVFLVVIVIFLGYVVLYHPRKSEIDCSPASSSNNDEGMTQGSIEIFKLLNLSVFVIDSFCWINLVATAEK